MAATTTFAIGPAGKTAGNYTEVAMAYLQDEVRFDFILGVSRKVNRCMTCVFLHFCISVSMLPH